MVQFTVNCCNSQKLCDKAVDYQPQTLEYVPDCYMTQEMCENLLLLILLN